MAKLKSPLKAVRVELDLSRSELASLAYPNRDNHREKAELAQSIARCEAGLLNPKKDCVIKFLFEKLTEHGYKTLMTDQVAWREERKVEIKKS